MSERPDLSQSEGQIQRGYGAPERMGNWLTEEAPKEDIKDDYLGEAPELSSQDMDRRDFLKIAAGTAGAMAAGAAAAKFGGEAWLKEDEERSEEKKTELEKASTERFQVVTWGKEVAPADHDKPRTLDELRAAAGWDRSYQKEFLNYLREKYPNQVDENALIQPGFYEVPIKPIKK
ncbi:MAG: ubiquinol-cytochrome c reductase iron-sulfur subunit N-terminal domain-containing protein [Patescibacteria group bacterium]|nr:ubiquinol-cytochrome c reductase iron-sulfur subunit N-terminal domain-containing protein [Patescibacteria group bacterium]